jgi:hypothetical protein
VEPFSFGILSININSVTVLGLFVFSRQDSRARRVLLSCKLLDAPQKREPMLEIRKEHQQIRAHVSEIGREVIPSAGATVYY